MHARSQKLRPVAPSFSMEWLCSHWTAFHEIWHFIIFRKYVGKIQVSVQSDKNNRRFPWRPLYMNDSISLNST